MKLDFLIFGLVLLFLFAIGISGKSHDPNLPIFYAVTYEHFNKDSLSIYRIHSINIEANTIKYISEARLESKNDPLGKGYNEANVAKQDDCIIIDSNNWKCGSIWSGLEMVNGNLRDRSGYKKYRKIYYIFRFPVLKIDT